MLVGDAKEVWSPLRVKRLDADAQRGHLFQIRDVRKTYPFIHGISDRSLRLHHSILPQRPQVVTETIDARGGAPACAIGLISKRPREFAGCITVDLCDCGATGISGHAEMVVGPERPGLAG